MFHNDIKGMTIYREHNVQFPSIFVHAVSMCMCSVVVKHHWMMVVIAHNSYSLAAR